MITHTRRVAVMPSVLLVLASSLSPASATTVPQARQALAQAAGELLNGGEYPAGVSIQLGSSIVAGTWPAGPGATAATSLSLDGSFAIVTVNLANIAASYSFEAMCSKDVLKEILRHEFDHINRIKNGTAYQGPSSMCEEALVKKNDLERWCEQMAGESCASELCELVNATIQWLNDNALALLAACGLVCATEGC